MTPAERGRDGLNIPASIATWHDKSIEEVVALLGSDAAAGLTDAAVRSGRERYGFNELQEVPPTPFWAMLLQQFNNFLIIILLAAAMVSFLLGDYIEAGAIMAIVILNAILGVVQEARAEQALAALKKMSAPDAHVIRNGHFANIPARELLPGDAVLLETGNYIPADVRLTESVNLRVDEASLTGESVPVEKRAGRVLDAEMTLGERLNSAYMSTLITYGRGKGIVADTVMRTEMGRIAEMIQSYEEEPTPLQLKLDQLGRWLGIGSLVICALVGIIGIVRDTSLEVLFSQGIGAYLALYQDVIVDMFLTAVSLAIAAVPEGLPAVVTMVLALGMREMVRRHALIRRLPAVETLGSSTVICSDKTGTLTKNEMMAVRLYANDALLRITGEGYSPEGELLDDGKPANLGTHLEAQLLLRAAMLCNDAWLEPDDSNGSWRMVGDPTEGALVVAAAKVGLWREELEQDYPRLAEIPFDSDRKRMTTIHREDGTGRCVAYVKGAPDIMLELCNRMLEDGQELALDATVRQRLLKVNAELAGEALRVLAVAYCHLDEVPERPEIETIERDLVFVGLIGMIDPARPEVRGAVQSAREAGLKSVMITGDYQNTAVAIANELALLRPGGEVLSGRELDALSDAEFLDRVEAVDVYARVSPQHKVRIVEALKKHGHVVAMTGDGVNDAPALKRANIGVAMGISGTDVSKETADMVLTDDNYASIVSAIEAGRVIYSNIRKFVYYLLSCNMGEITVIFLAMLGNLGIPLTPIQLLWLNLLTDGAPALALGMEKGDPDIMKHPPRKPNEPIIDSKMVVGIAVQTVFITVATLSAYIVGLRMFPDNIEHARTMAFVTLSASELFRAYTARSEYYSIFQIGVFSNKYMQLAVGASALLLILVIYVPFLNPIFNTFPLTLRDWGIILPLILLPSVAAEIMKWMMRARGQNLASTGSGAPR
jgi:Ca2+-transporting ATPase